MPLTPAEKMKRYREKLKKDPERYEEYKKKDVKRIKAKTKKISELSEQDKEQRRKKWREQKRKQKAKNTGKNAEEVKSTTQPTKDNKRINQRRLCAHRALVRKNEATAKKIELQQKTIEMLRKRFFRLKKETANTIGNLELTILKMKAREEVLEIAVRSVYTKCKTRKEKRLLKSLAYTKPVRESKSMTYVAKLLGLKGSVRIMKKANRYQKNLKIKKQVGDFFLRDDISRSTAGKKECRTFQKEKMQIRFLTDTLFNLYQIYKEEGGAYSFTTFFRHKPFYVLSPNVQNRETCMCIKHSNMEMLFTALKKSGVLPEEVKSLTDAISKLVCNLKSYDCMYDKCISCKSLKLKYKLESDIVSRKVKWQQWVRVDHKYDKIEKGEVKHFTTKKTVKKCNDSKVEELIDMFEKKVTAFKVHFFNWKHQQCKYQEKIQNLGQSEILLLCDFSENYECKLREEVQSSHFGASKNQITLHCGMIYWAEKAQSFCTVSNSKCHEPSAIWAHLMPIIELVKCETPEVNTIHFFSDGPSSQYRQKKNFYLLNYFATQLNMKYCTWNFSESGHGKGVADGIGGAVKRALDKQVAYGHDIADGTEAFAILKLVMKSVKCFFVEDVNIDRIGQILLPLNLQPVPGTMKIHQVISHTGRKSQIQHRELSCFCVLDDNQNKICKCFLPKIHTYPNAVSTENNPKKGRSEAKVMSETVQMNANDIMTHRCSDTSAIKGKEVNEIHDVTKQIVLKENYEMNIDDDTMKDGCSDISIIAKMDHAEIYDWIKDWNDNIPLKDSDLIIIDDPKDAISAANHKKKESYAKKEYSETKDIKKNDQMHIDNNNMKNVCNNNPVVRNSYQEIYDLTQVKKVKLPDNKENVVKNPSLRTIVSRELQCLKCRIKLPFTSRDLVKCMACKKMYCLRCTDGQNDFDYICRPCFGEE